MLETLDNIPWENLEHAYGSAEDVPDCLRGIISADKKVREQSWGALYGNIYHQGTIYQATTYAVPFLIEMLDNESVIEKENILQYLVRLVFGSSYHDVHQHLSSYKDKRNTAEFQEQVRDELQWVFNTYYAIEKGIPYYLDLVRHPSADVRMSSAYLLGFLLKNAPPIITFTLEGNYANEKNHLVRAMILCALKYSGEHVEECEHLFDEGLEDEHAIIRLISAQSLVYLKEINDKVVDVMKDSLKNVDSITSDYNKLPCTNGDLMSDISAVLPNFGDTAKEFLPVLFAHFQIVDAYSALELVSSILFITFEGKVANENATFSRFTAIQQETLKVISETDNVWKFSGNMSGIMRDYQLPRSRKELQEFIGL